MIAEKRIFPFPSLPFPSLPFPSLPFPSSPFSLFCFFSFLFFPLFFFFLDDGCDDDPLHVRLTWSLCMVGAGTAGRVGAGEGGP